MLLPVRFSLNNLIIFLCFSFISVYSLVLSPAYPERCWMFAFVYLVIIIGISLSKIEEGKYSALIKKLYIFLMIYWPVSVILFICASSTKKKIKALEDR